MAKATQRKSAEAAGDSAKKVVKKAAKKAVTKTPRPAAKKKAPATKVATTRKAAVAKKPTAATKVAAKPAAAKKGAKKVVAKPTVVKKVAAKTPAPKKKPAAARVESVVKAKKSATTVKLRAPESAARPVVEAFKKQSARARKPAARPAVEAVKKQVVRARRPQSALLEVSPSIIDTSNAAEVAARLVVDGHGVAAPNPLGNVFAPPPAVAVKRGSSALRAHVKEMLNKPVARQLDSVFGPAPVPTESLRRFLKGQRAARNQRVRGTTNFHSGQPNVGHRSVG